MEIIAGIVSCENIITGGKGRTCTKLQRGLEVAGEKCTFEGGGEYYEHIFYLLNDLNLKMQYFWGGKEANDAVWCYS